jgi:pimeloyl-ACP methyl ester carboxylesterase
MKTRSFIKSIVLNALIALCATLNVYPQKAEQNKLSTGNSLENHIVTSDGTQLHYKDWGKGKIIVFLHSWGVNSDIWQYQMNYLANSGFRCIAYDRRGHGRSSQPWGGYDYDTLASDLHALIDTLNLDNITLVSHSMAGGEVIRYLSKFGNKKIAGVVITSPNLPFMLKTDDNPFGVDQAVTDQFHSYLQTDIHGTLRAGVNIFFGENPQVSKDMIEWGISLFHQTSLRELIECNKSNMQTYFRDELKKINVPTLLIHGDKDVSAPLPLTSQRCEELMPNAELKIYINAPHGIILTHKDEMAKDILSFINNYKS